MKLHLKQAAVQADFVESSTSGNESRYFITFACLDFAMYIFP